MMIQAGWNFERMQNIGFAFALCPALKKIWTTPQTLKQALKRHMAPFNTQPYMSSFVLGLAWRLEERMAAKAASQQPSEAALPSTFGEGLRLPDDSKDGRLPRDNARSQSSQGKESFEEHQMRAAKKTASSALAAIGDTLFWGTMRSGTLEICLIIWCFFGFYSWIVPISGQGIVGTLSPVGRESIPLSVILIGLMAGLIVYNGFALWVRWRGLDLGYECGQKNSISCGLDAVNWQKIIRILKIFCFAAAVLIIVLLAIGSVKTLQGRLEHYVSWCGLLVTPLLIFVFAWIMKKFKFTNVSACGIMFLALVALLYLLDNFVV